MLVACTTANGKFDGDSGLAPEDDSQVGADDSGQSDTADLDVAWLGLDGRLILTAGVASSIELQARLYVDPPGESPVCAVSRVAEAGEVLATTPDDAVFHWWRVVLTTPDGEDSCGERVPAQLLLGLGALDPEIVPALEAHGVDDAASSLYGAFANPYDDGGEAQASTGYVFGFAGTASDRAGASPAVTAAPMPDGDYSFTGFYLFDLRE